MDNLVSLSLRANQFNDYEGGLILDQIKYVCVYVIIVSLRS